MNIHRHSVFSSGVVVIVDQPSLNERVLVVLRNVVGLKCRNPENLLPSCSHQVVQGRLVRLNAIGGADVRQHVLLDDVFHVVHMRHLVVGFPCPRQKTERKGCEEIDDCEDDETTSGRQPRRKAPGARRVGGELLNSLNWCSPPCFVASSLQRSVRLSH